MLYITQICIYTIMLKSYSFGTLSAWTHIGAAHYGRAWRRLERHGTQAALNPDSRWQQTKKADPVGFTTTLPLSCAAALALEAAVVWGTSNETEQPPAAPFDFYAKPVLRTRRQHVLKPPWKTNPIRSRATKRRKRMGIMCSRGKTRSWKTAWGARTWKTTATQWVQKGTGKKPWSGLTI